MLLQPPTGSERRAWWAVAAWTAALYTLVFFARDIQEFVARTIGRNAFTVAVVAAVLSGLAWLLRWLRRNRPSPRFFAGALFSAGVYLAGIWHLRRAPEEAMHLLQYGGLSLLVFRALGHRMRDPAIYFAGACLCGLIGTGDEILQWIAPRRAFDFRDIGINVLAGLGVQLLLAFVLRPPWVRPPVAHRSFAVAGWIAGGWALVVVACLQNTLARQTRYLARLTFLPASVRTMQDTMVEYGHLHRDPDIGAFYSRLTIEELRAQDGARAAAAGAAIRAARSPAGREAFCARVTGVSDPFLYEAFIHLFRRNRYAHDAGDAHNSAAHMHYAATIAYREDQILARYFPKTLAAAGEALKPAYREAVERLADRVTPHTSAVSSQLLTQFGPGQALAGLGLLCVAAWCFALYHARKA